MNWEFIGSTVNDSFIINGIDVFKEKWINTGRRAEIIDPIYGAKKYFTIWKINTKDNEIIFAAGEFSNCVWGIYMRK